MGRVSAFLGMVLYMYPEKNGRHNRPHVHVLYGEEECVLSVPEGEAYSTATRIGAMNVFPVFGRMVFSTRLLPTMVRLCGQTAQTSAQMKCTIIQRKLEP